MLLIPAIDLKDGHCVRLKQGDMDQATVFSDDPARMARHWLERGEDFWGRGQQDDGDTCNGVDRSAGNGGGQV